MVEGFAAISRGFERDRNIFFDALLADIFGERFGANAGVEACSSSYGAPETMRCAGGLASCVLCSRQTSLPLFLTTCRDGVEHVQPYVPAR